MFIISHRANIYGPSPSRENSPDYITEAINLGYQVEIDVWNFGNEWFLGHDVPQYKTTIDFLQNDALWIHAKNIKTLNCLLSLNNINCFFHDRDDCTLTSRGYIWTFPERDLTFRSIAVMPERADQIRYPEWNISKPSSLIGSCAGICTDYPEHYKLLLSLNE